MTLRSPATTWIGEPAQPGATTPTANVHYQNGVIGFASEVKPAHIVDGLSKTYLIGEKFVAPKAYNDNTVYGNSLGGFGDNQSMYVGYEWDNQRVAWTSKTPPPFSANTADFQPSADSDAAADDIKAVTAFGSAHAGGLNMAFCDGSVQSVSYDIDPQAHREQAIRNDEGDVEGDRSGRNRSRHVHAHGAHATGSADLRRGRRRVRRHRNGPSDDRHTRELERPPYDQ